MPIPLVELLNAFEGRGSFFFLGAGVSTPIVPMVGRLGELVLERALAASSFPVEPVQLDSIASRIVGEAKRELLRRLDSFDDVMRLRTELSERISPSAVHAIAIELLRPHTPSRCLQYEVFQLAKYSATILNFNTDAMANVLGAKHLVINVHGTSLSPKLRDDLV